MSGDPVTNTLRALQRRLWLERSLYRLRAATWIGSFSLLAIAVVSAYWFPMAPLLATLIALVAVILVMLSAISLRPSLKVCALRADRQFGSDLLLTSALELSNSPRSEIPAAGYVVLQQATDAAPRWQQNLASVWHAPAPSGFALATIPVFVAALLLSLSTYRGVDASVNGQPGESAATGSASENFLEDDNDLLVLRESIVRNSSPRPPLRSDQDAAANTKMATPDMLVSHDDKRLPAAAESDAASTGLATEGPAGGSDAGDAQPAMQARETAPQAGGESFAALSTLKIERLGAAHAGSEETDEEFTTAALAPETNRARVRAAAAPPALSAWTTLTPAEVTYARRYLDSTEDSRD